MKIKPLADRVLIQPTPAEETTISGISKLFAGFDIEFDFFSHDIW